jgi:hypothetical protein
MCSLLCVALGVATIVRVWARAGWKVPRDKDTFDQVVEWHLGVIAITAVGVWLMNSDFGEFQ